VTGIILIGIFIFRDRVHTSINYAINYVAGVIGTGNTVTGNIDATGEESHLLRNSTENI
jgi:hypothetical protein